MRANVLAIYGLFDTIGTLCQPCREVIAEQQPELGGLARTPKVGDTSISKGSPVHYAVRRSSRPSRRYGQASHTIANVNRGSDHCSRAASKPVWLLAFDRDVRMPALLLGGARDQSVEKPLDTSTPDCIVRGSEPKVIGHGVAARVNRALLRLIEHFLPDLVEFGHRPSIDGEPGKWQ
jgi:hypothetical protein